MNTLQISGIKCDNPDCDYKNEKIQLQEYKDWLNKPCPKCGQNLLTEDDYNTVKFMGAIVQLANETDKSKDEEPKIKMSIEMNGTGNIKINENI